MPPRSFFDKSFSKSWSIGKRQGTNKTARKFDCDHRHTIHPVSKCCNRRCNQCDFESICLLRDISELSAEPSTASSISNDSNFSAASPAPLSAQEEIWNFTKDSNSSILRTLSNMQKNVVPEINAINFQNLYEWCDRDRQLMDTILRTFCEQARQNFFELMQAFALNDISKLSFHSVSLNTQSSSHARPEF